MDGQKVTVKDDYSQKERINKKFKMETKKVVKIFSFEMQKLKYYLEVTMTGKKDRI